MRFLLPFAWALLCAFSPAVAQPSIDPAFQPSVIYQPAPVRAVLQMANGARVLAGDIRQASGQPANQLVRYLPNGTFDAAFAANVAGYQWYPQQVVEAPGGKLLVLNSYWGSAPPAGSRAGALLTRLNADGTVDQSFTLASAPSLVSASISGLLAQPDGRVLIRGDFVVGPFAGSIAPQSRYVLRLNVDGSLDAGFLSAPGRPNYRVDALALQTDGRLLLGGQFDSVQGQPRQGLVRLLPGGGFDASFSAQGTPGTSSRVGGLLVQPDGKILVAGARPLNGVSSGLVRVDASGAHDPTFSISPTTSARQMQLLPTGRLLVQTPYGGLERLQADGSLDPSFQSPHSVYVSAWQALPSGQVLVGSLNYFYPGPAYGVNALLLDIAGQPDLSFSPHLQGPGRVHDVVVQADGRIVIGGSFDEVNGTAAHGLARLNANGTLDTNHAPQTVPHTTVNTLALQADGKLLVGGSFGSLGGASCPSLARLLPTGAADATFVPVASSLGGPPAWAVQHVALQPSGRVLVLGSGRWTGLQRLLTTGQADASFQPAFGLNAQTFAVQPDARIVAAGQYYPVAGPIYPVVRLLPNGAVDPSFALTAPATFFNLRAPLTLYPDGRVLLSFFGGYGNSPQRQLARLLPDGTVDASFNVGTNNGLAAVYTMCVQPNGRVLVGGSLLNPGSTLQGFSGSARLLPDGTLDNTYFPLSGPEEMVYKFAIQPDGKILAAGNFSSVSGLPIIGLTRLVDPNVLSISPTARAAALTAWPVPAREALHVQLDATAQPQRVQLLDALGRAVRTQAATSAALTLPTAGLAPGVYLLRVEYATGAATRRVLVE